MRAVIALVLLGGLGACQREPHDARLARTIIASRCAGCHTVPGVPEANGRVGPVLDRLASQQVIAGRLPNSRANLAYWVGHAQQVDPGVVMPTIPLSNRQAFAVADYLLSVDDEQ